MKRFFDYEGRRFVMTAEFNTKVERRPDGVREHTLKVSVLYNYNASYTFTDGSAELVVAQAEADCRRWHEAEKKKGTTEATLAGLGFTK